MSGYKKILSGMIVLSLISGLSFAQTIEKSPDRIITLYNEGMTSEIIETLSLKDTVQMSAGEWFYLGMSCANQKNYIKAEKALRNASIKNPAHTGYRFNLAKILSTLNKFEESAEQYNLLIQKDSLHTAALHELAGINMSFQNYGEAKKIYKRLTLINEDDLLANFYLAYAIKQTLSTKEDSADFIMYLDRAQKLGPEYAPAFELAGNYYFEVNQFYPALKNFAAAAVMNKKKASIPFMIGYCYEKLNLHQPAIQYFQKSVELNPEASNYFSHLGFVLFMNKEYDRALKAYRQAANLDFETPAHYINIALTYEKMDSSEQAVTFYEMALLRFPLEKISDTYNKLSAIFLREENFQKVLALSEKSLIINPYDAKSLYYQAYAYDKTGASERAAEKYIGALELMKGEDHYKNEIAFIKDRMEEIKNKAKEKSFWERQNVKRTN